MRSDGVDPGDIVWHVASRDELLRVVAHVVPNRFSHWTFGRQYLDLRSSAGRIYEFVVWDDPPQAYIDQTLSAAEVDVIVPHVLGHAAVFRENQWLGAAHRLGAEQWAAHAQWIDEHDDEWQRESQLLTPSLTATDWTAFCRQFPPDGETGARTRFVVPPCGLIWAELTPLDLLLSLESVTLAPWERTPAMPSFPWTSRPVANAGSGGLPAADPPDAALDQLGRLHWGCVDVLDILGHFARSKRTREAAEWFRHESDFLHCLMATKFLNEGYATYWHQRQGTSVDAEGAVWDRTLLRSGVELPHLMNPYWMGSAIFRQAALGGGDPHALMRVARDDTFITQGMTSDVIRALSLLPIFTQEHDDHWAVHHGEADPVTLAVRLQQHWIASLHGGVGQPRIVWDSPKEVRVTGQWGIPELADADARPLTLEVRWWLGLATLLGRTIMVTVPEKTHWHGAQDLPKVLPEHQP